MSDYRHLNYFSSFCCSYDDVAARNVSWLPLLALWPNRPLTEKNSRPSVSFKHLFIINQCSNYLSSQLLQGTPVVQYQILDLQVLLWYHYSRPVQLDLDLQADLDDPA